MAFNLADRVRETTTTIGTGAFALGGAVTGFRSFASGLSIGDTTWYAAVNAGTNPAQYEVGLGTLSASGTLQRTSVLGSSDNNSIVSFSEGNKDVFITIPASFLKSISEIRPTKVEIFNTSGTWTKDPAAKSVIVYIKGGDGGGASGSRQASGTNSPGGGGGGGAGYNYAEYAASDLPASVPIIVGTAGLGGASVTTDSSAGLPGAAGGDSQFGVLADGHYLLGPGGQGGSGQSGGQTVLGFSNKQVGSNGGSGGNALGSAGNSATFGSTGGGGGAGQPASLGTYNGGRGGIILSLLTNSASVTPGGIGSTKTAAVSASPRTLDYGLVGFGAGGGWSNADGTAGAGASVQAGAAGGGGGGGGSLNGNPSGKGGDGGAGRIVVVTRY